MLGHYGWTAIWKQPEEGSKRARVAILLWQAMFWISRYSSTAERGLSLRTGNIIRTLELTLQTNLPKRIAKDWLRYLTSLSEQLRRPAHSWFFVLSLFFIRYFYDCESGDTV